LFGEGELFLRGAGAPLHRLIPPGSGGDKLRDKQRMILGGRVGIDRKRWGGGEAKMVYPHLTSYDTSRNSV